MQLLRMAAEAVAQGRPIMQYAGPPGMRPGGGGSGAAVPLGECGSGAAVPLGGGGSGAAVPVMPRFLALVKWMAVASGAEAAAGVGEV